MAKKRFNISSTLNKNKSTTPLSEKIPLKKTEKEPEEIKAKVEQLHDAPPKAQKSASSKPKTVKRSRKSKPVGEEKPRLVRMTIDTPEEMHKRLKIRSVERGISIRDYILRLIEKDLK